MRNGLVVFAFTPRLEVGQGGRVLVGPIAAMALIAFAAVSAFLVRRR